jgi:hypothetical protein
MGRRGGEVQGIIPSSLMLVQNYKPKTSDLIILL